MTGSRLAPPLAAVSEPCAAGISRDDVRDLPRARPGIHRVSTLG